MRSLLTSRSPFYFSLKWQVVCSVSALLILTSFIFWKTATHYTNEQFLRERQTVQANYRYNLNSVMADAFQRLNQLAYIIPNLTVHSTPHTFDNSTSIPLIFEEHAPLLNLEYGLDSAWYFTAPETVVFRWNGHDLDPAIQKIITKTFNDYSPQSLLDCHQECTIYSAVPVLTASGEVHVLLLANSIAELLINFHRINHAEVGIFSIHNLKMPTHQHTAKSPLIHPWNIHLHAFSHLKEKQALLTSIINNTSLHKVIQSPQLYQYQQHWFELSVLPIGGDSKQAHNSWLLIVNDITNEKNSLIQHNNKMIITAISSLFIMILLLFLILQKPFLQLSRISSVLCLFPDNQFKQIRHRLSSPVHKTGLKNEVSVLQESTIALSYQLEDLQAQVKAKTQELLQNSQALMQERDFVKGLINTSDAIILTQNQDGQILMINDKGKKLFNVNTDQSNLSFESLLFPFDAIDDHISQQLQLIRQGKLHHFQHESQILHGDKTHHTLSWYHSKLSIEGMDHSVMMSIGIDITERKIIEEQLSWVADHDALTKLFNRRRFHQEMEKALKVAQTNGTGGALFYFDIDYFKFVNDSLGHQAGDRLLQMIADKLRITLKQNDIIARLGGDEFCVILPDINESIACNIAERINNTVRSIHSPSLGGTHKISVSIGIVIYPDNGDNISDLLANADIAMYKTKERQRGTYTLFSNTIHSRQKIHQLMNSKQRIEYALENESFVLYYQPIYSINTSRITHYETLLRMLDVNQNILLPGQFIPEAEHLGLIQEIDKLVIKKSIQALSNFQKQNNHPIHLSVNLSGKAIDDQNISDYIKAQLAEYNINTQYIIFELTETVAVSDISKAEQLMSQLKSIGCRFALDDFGVGFSSFIYLKQLPVDYVKIDGLFIKNLHQSQFDQLFVKAMNEIAHGLGKKTIAEFVENQEILEILTTLGVDYAQGYHIGRPQPYLVNEDEHTTVIQKLQYSA